MPTARHRHMLTETDAVRAALDVAAQHWPGETPTQLLYRLISEGQHALRHNVQHRRQVITANAGMLAGIYGRDYLAQLRQEWPE